MPNQNPLTEQDARPASEPIGGNNHAARPVAQGAATSPRAKESNTPRKEVVVRSDYFNERRCVNGPQYFTVQVNHAFEELNLAQLLESIGKRNPTKVEIFDRLFPQILECQTDLRFNSVKTVSLEGNALGCNECSVREDLDTVDLLIKLKAIFPEAKIHHQGSVWSTTYKNTDELGQAAGVEFTKFKPCYNPEASSERDDEQDDIFGCEF